MQTNYSIIYAEDDLIIRERYSKFLRLYFKNVYEVSDGSEAYELFKEKKPDILLLDINLPTLDGLSLAKKIREQNNDVLLIMLTAYSQKDKLLQAIELNLFKYLIKPINTLELEEVIENSLKKLATIKNNQKYLFLDGEFIWDKSNEILLKNQQQIKLTKNEALLMKLFCSNPFSTYSSVDVIYYIWEDDFSNELTTNKLRTLFSRLKTKLNYNLFDSIYNIGYKINLKRGF